MPPELSRDPDKDVPVSSRKETLEGHTPRLMTSGPLED